VNSERIRNPFIRIALLGTLVLAGALASAPASAATIDYGDFAGVHVNWLDVHETTGGGDFGAPTATGDALDFSPLGFGAVSNDGAFGSVTGDLHFEVVGSGGASIQTLFFSESGDYTLLPNGMPAMTTYAATAMLRILDVDGAALGAPIEAMLDIGTDMFSSFTPVIGAVWSTTASADLDLILSDAGQPGAATRVEVWLMNQLTAMTMGPGSSALITKKDFDVVASAAPPIPEPSDYVLFSVGAVIVLTTLRRRSEA